MDLYIVTMVRGNERAKFAVHTYDVRHATTMAQERRNGWTVEDAILDNRPKAICFAREELIPEDSQTEPQSRSEG